MNVFGLKKAFGGPKDPFSALCVFFPKKNNFWEKIQFSNKIQIFVSSSREVVFDLTRIPSGIDIYPFGYILGHSKFDKVVTKVSLKHSRNFSLLNLEQGADSDGSQLVKLFVLH